MREVSEEIFLKDVKDHEMTILRDDGLYRHLRFASTGQYSWNQWFEIVTWPHRLVYTGDMGTFVFTRLPDMFEFFRGRPSDNREGLYINTGYWAEKLLAVDRCGYDNSECQYSEEKFKEHVEDHVSEWFSEYGLIDREKGELREALEDEVLSCGESEHDAHQALRDFSFSCGSHKFEFHDTWEWNLREYTGRFVWCCYALAWAIKQYDQQTKGTQVEEQIA